MAITIDSHHHLWQYSADDYPWISVPLPQKHVTVWAEKAVGIAGIDQEDLKPLGLEQLVRGDPVDAGRFQGGCVDLVLPQEGRNGFQARRVGREFLNQAGIGFGSEADADPVGAGTDVDAGGVRALHGHSRERWCPWRRSSCQRRARLLMRGSVFIGDGLAEDNQGWAARLTSLSQNPRLSTRKCAASKIE
jgi:hypothetical protein